MLSNVERKLLIVASVSQFSGAHFLIPDWAVELESEAVVKRVDYSHKLKP